MCSVLLTSVGMELQGKACTAECSVVADQLFILVLRPVGFIPLSKLLVSIGDLLARLSFKRVELVPVLDYVSADVKRE